jgi:hypothetical protein
MLRFISIVSGNFVMVLVMGWVAGIGGLSGGGDNLLEICWENMQEK